MKIIYCIAFCLLMGNMSYSQILKKVLNDAKNQGEWKVRSKAMEKTNQALDTLLSQPKKAVQKKNIEETEQDSVFTSNSTENSAGSDDNMNISEGYITLSLSADEVLAGGIVRIEGSSLKYGSLKEVRLIIDGPGGKKTEALALSDDHKFLKRFQTSAQGEYTITVISSDGKAEKSDKLKVGAAPDWTAENKDETTQCFELIRKRKESLKNQISNKDKEDLEKKMAELKTDVDKLIEFFNELSKARRELEKNNTKLPEPVNSDISKLNEQLHEQKTQMKQLRETADHEPYDNSICEQIVMFNEACAAFSTLTSWVKGPLVIITKIVKDNTPLGNISGNPNQTQIAGIAEQPAKLFALSKLNAEKLTAVDFTEDVLSFVGEYLLKKYCNTFEGTVQHDYQITYRNEIGAKWWEYNYRTEATISLRYPKSGTGGRIIKMKGSIEGNALQFNFFQDIEMLDDFRKEIKSRGKVYPVQLQTPASIPVSTSQYTGLGAVARGLVTPAYFYIPVDAEFDTEANTVRLFLNEPLIDFSTLVKWKMGYVVLAAGIPLVTTVDFPINKAYPTLNAVISHNNVLHAITDGQKNISLTGSGVRLIGDGSSAIEHSINFTLIANSKQ